MGFDDLMRRYFGTAELPGLSSAELAAGSERLAVDFGLEADPARRFALWALMYILGSAPDLDVAFKDAGERDAARNFMDLYAGIAPPSQ
ncbi:MAG: hypothetical protein KGQ75_08840 [Sphingomonadales bacterium]|uniref:hypothetical protein n=1 Tax=Novosphingobium sp. NDB2Meth1 TaxID=1892847 RepID=UPI0009314FCA|nr:hypothetical protein [Novosphingobium sp. NDB2Meth1]MBU6394667.1 hypothetical protein [Sphingomonadales bacterium]MBY0393826.1 hypothetical protein [Novosphingobium sp.]